MPSIPNGINEVTAAWLSDVTGWSVDELTTTEIGAGIGMMSAVYRASLTGSNCPSTVIVKLTALDPANGFTAQVLSLYKREAIFFNDLASQSPIRVPQGYHAAVNDDGSQVAIVMEDIGTNRPCDQVAGMSIQDAEQTVDLVAIAAFDLIEGDGAKARIIDVGRERSSDGERTERAGDEAR